MSTNLNALIRYKTIDASLSNLHLECSIEILIAKCQEALREFQSTDTGISERSIRNDIRVLRSDILGFNAPIVVKHGIYSYSDSKYSIFKRPFIELELLKEIQSLLVEQFDNIKNKNLSYLLIELAKITDDKIPKKCAPEDYLVLESKQSRAKNHINYFRSDLESYVFSLFKKNQPPKSLFRFLKKSKKHEYMEWRFIFEAL